MNGPDSSASDPYVQEFVLDTFSNVAIKPELCPNPIADSSLNDDAVSTAAPTPSSASIVGLPEDDLVLRHSTPDSVIMSHSQIPHRLPPMSLLHSQASPPHLLTPPDSQEDYYHQQHHHLMLSNNMMKNSNLIIPGNLPDTPPINSPPLPPAIYHHMEHLHMQPQYPPLQALHHLHQPPSEVAEDMLWQSTDLQQPRQEPLDLRPHCNGDSIQNWNMMQQHTSVITCPGKRIYHTDYFHQQASLGQYPATGQLQGFSPLLTNSATSPSSTSSSLSLSLTSTTKSVVAHNGLESQTRGIDGRVNASRNSSRGRARAGATGKMQMSGPANGNSLVKDRPPNSEVKIDDDLLLKINVRELNVKLKGTTKDQQAKTKQRRRTLKNRIYAQNCRNKRNEQKTKLEVAKIELEQDLKAQKARVTSLQKDMSRMQSELVRERQENEKIRLEFELLLQKFRDMEVRSNIAPSRCSSSNLATNLSVTSSVGDY